MDMKLKDLLEEKRSAITKKWFEAIMETYPTDTSGFLRKVKSYVCQSCWPCDLSGGGEHLKLTKLRTIQWNTKRRKQTNID